MQEIRSYEQPTRIANAPAFLKGVVNLRGVIVPIVDLRVKLGCEARIQPLHRGDRAQRQGPRGRRGGRFGVATCSSWAGPIRAAPEMRTAVDTSFLTGIGSVDERMLILMDIEALMASADMGLIDSASH